MCVYTMLKIAGSDPSTKKKRKETKTMLKGVHNIEETWSWRDGSTVRVLDALAECLEKIRKKGLISRSASLNSLTE